MIQSFCFVLSGEASSRIKVFQGEGLGTKEVISFEVFWGTTVRVQGPETHDLRQEKVKAMLSVGEVETVRVRMCVDELHVCISAEPSVCQSSRRICAYPQAIWTD